MSRRFLLRVAAIAAMIAGTLRVGTTFTSGVLAGDPAELVYLVIDLGLLAGLLAAYLSRSQDLRRLGFAGFAIALPGAAIIVGPDGEMFSVALYQAGGALMVLGLALLAVAQLRAGLARLVSSLGWLASLVSMTAAAMIPNAFIVLGVTFGLSFVAIGRELLREANAEEVPDAENIR